MKKVIQGVVAIAAALLLCPEMDVLAAEYQLVEMGEYGRPWLVDDTQEQIDEEIELGEMELLAQLVHAEADVVLNRVKSDEFPNTVHEVIFQPGQFSVVNNGAWEKAAYNMEETDYTAVSYEWDNLTNTEVLYFNNSSNVSGGGTPFKVGDHWFNTQ